MAHALLTQPLWLDQMTNTLSRVPLQDILVHVTLSYNLYEPVKWPLVPTLAWLCASCPDKHATRADLSSQAIYISHNVHVCKYSDLYA